MRTTTSDLRDPRGDELANVLDWWGLEAVDPAILSTKTGRFQLTFAARCLDTEQMEPDERGWYLARLDEVLRVLNAEWTLDADWWHAPTTVYPATDWEALDAPLSDRLVDSLRRLDFEHHPRHVSTLYLTPSWQPPRGTRQLLQHLFVTRGTERRVQRGLTDLLELFQEGATRFQSLLAPLMEALTPLDGHELCTYLHQCVSWDRHAIRCPDPAYDLDMQLTSDVWRPGQPPMLGDQLLQPLTIKTWQPTLRTYLPEALSKLPFPCRYHVRWVPMSARTADTFLTWAEKRWAGGYRGLGKLFRASTGVEDATEVQGRGEQEGAIAAGQSIIDMRKAVLRGQAVTGFVSPTVLCWGADQHELDDRVKVVTEVLFQQGLVVRQEKANASIQWLASLPGHVKYGIRAFALSTPHLTAILPHTQMWSGPEEDRHLKAPPLLMASTDGAPFRLVTHYGELGNVFMAGPSRSGKSGGLGLMIRQAFRYPKMRVCLFDDKYALKAVTLLRGGHHYDLGTPGCARLQPLGDLDTEARRQWATLWVEQVLAGEGLPPDPDERRELWRLIQMLSDLPRHQRTLSMARQLLQVQRLKVGLAPFCEGGEYAFCDGDGDAIAWESRLLCFEMSAIKSKPRALAAVLSYCFQQLETEWFRGDPVTIVVEEARWLAAIERFLGELEVWLKARAKLNVAVWLSTQELYDMQRTTLWQAILASMPTRLLLPNPQALRASVKPFYQELGVSERSLHLLAQAHPLRDYLYVSPLGQRLYQCALSPVERLLCAASRPEELRVLDAMARQYRPEELPARWLEYWGYPDEAALLEPQTEGTSLWSDISLGTAPASSLVLGSR